MSELKRTETRHALLATVAADRDFEYDPPLRSKPGVFGHRGGYLTLGTKRGLTELLRSGLIATTANADWSLGEDVDLSAEGRALLAAWNDQYGEPQP